ncbi:1-deoxy-D-xylulose-5-phosphate synthase N-terminal domain-containing protein [Spirillospora sp. NPDC050679]
MSADGPGDAVIVPRGGPPPLAEHIRRFLARHVCVTGGHLRPNPGVVELTPPPHRLFHWCRHWW